MKILIIPYNIDKTTATWKLINDIESLWNTKKYKIVKYKNNLGKLITLFKLKIKYPKKEIILMYPLFFLTTMNFLIKLLHIIPTLIWKNKINLFIYDLPIEHNKYINWTIPTIFDKIYEKYIFKISSKIFCFNKKMLIYIRKNYNIKKNKIYTYEILAAFHKYSTNKNNTIYTKWIVYIWNINQNYWLDLNKVKFNLEIFWETNNTNQMINNKIIIKSKVKYNILIEELTKYKFWLVDYSNNIKSYLKYWTWSKLLIYIISGLPILVNKELEYPSYIVKKYKLWIVYSNINDIPKILKSIDENKYKKIKKNINNFKATFKTPKSYIKNYLPYF